MALQYQIGPLTLKHLPFSADRVSRTNTAGIAIKPVVGARQPGEWVGPDEDVLTISGVLFPHHQGGKTEIEIAHALVNGLPIYILRGDLRPMGWWQVTRVQEDAELMDEDGVGKRIVVTLNMRKAPRPTVEGLVRSLIALFG